MDKDPARFANFKGTMGLYPKLQLAIADFHQTLRKAAAERANGDEVKAYEFVPFKQNNYPTDQFGADYIGIGLIHGSTDQDQNKTIPIHQLETPIRPSALIDMIVFFRKGEENDYVRLPGDEALIAKFGLYEGSISYNIFINPEAPPIAVNETFFQELIDEQANRLKATGSGEPKSEWELLPQAIERYGSEIVHTLTDQECDAIYDAVMASAGDLDIQEYLAATGQ